MALRIILSGNWLAQTKTIKWEVLAQKILEPLKGEIEVGIIIADKIVAKKLNWDYRRRDYVPQVLTFPNNCEADPDGVTRIGDVVICGPLLAKEGKENLEQLACEWLEHGFKSLPFWACKE